MSRLIFDIETDGLLDLYGLPGDGSPMTKIHCIVTRDVGASGGAVRAYYDGPLAHAQRAGTIREGIAALGEAECLIGHNVAEYDVRAIQRVDPTFQPKGKIIDTLVRVRTIWPDIAETDFARIRRGATFPMRFAGKHSLEAWGHRLGVYKGDFAKSNDWSKFTVEMLDYCIQDTLVTAALWEKIAGKTYSEEAFELEARFASILALQERHGFLFDKQAADRLTATLLARRAEIDQELGSMILPFIDVYFTPKKKERKEKTVLFNPNSRDHIARHLMERRGWKPVKLTEGEAKPQIDEDVLRPLKDWPEAQLLNERFILQKRLGQLTEGKVSWTKLVGKDGRIHGRVNHNGAVTGRCTHSGPNMAQVPGVRKGKAVVEGKKVEQVLMGAAGGYGWESRSLFIVPPGFLLVGADASGLELRCLAHYMGKYDGGEYAKILLEGDIHSVNQAAAGLDTRDQAKTFIYAFLYGAGDEKIGSIVGKGAAAGKALKAAFLKKTPALAQLKHDIGLAVALKGTLRGLDGRILAVRSKHAALNTLLQSAGAIVMKKATVLLYDALINMNLRFGVDFANVAHVHDEVQIEAHERIATAVGVTAVASIRAAGDHFKFRCPLDGAYKIGRNWAETH